MASCDFCGAKFDILDRHVVAVPRPSDPTELVAVMWACPPCGKEQELPTAAYLEQAVEAGWKIEGRRYTFVTV